MALHKMAAITKIPINYDHLKIFNDPQMVLVIIAIKLALGDYSFNYSWPPNLFLF